MISRHSRGSDMSNGLVENSRAFFAERTLFSIIMAIPDFWAISATCVTRLMKVSIQSSRLKDDGWGCASPTRRPWDLTKTQRGSCIDLHPTRRTIQVLARHGQYYGHLSRGLNYQGLRRRGLLGRKIIVDLESYILCQHLQIVQQSLRIRTTRKLYALNTSTHELTSHLVCCSSTKTTS